VTLASDRAQYMAALSRANEVRLASAQARREVHALPPKEGARHLADLLENRDPRIESTPIGRLLRAILGIGDVKVGVLLRAAGVATQDRRVDHLTDRQVRALAEALRYPTGGGS